MINSFSLTILRNPVDEWLAGLIETNINGMINVNIVLAGIACNEIKF